MFVISLCFFFSLISAVYFHSPLPENVQPTKASDWLLCFWAEFLLMNSFLPNKGEFDLKSVSRFCLVSIEENYCVCVRVCLCVITLVPCSLQELKKVFLSQKEFSLLSSDSLFASDLHQICMRLLRVPTYPFRPVFLMAAPPG